MGLQYENLEATTRRLMVAEIEADIQKNGVYLSNYMNDRGKGLWPSLLKKAAEGGDDNSLSEELKKNGAFKEKVERKKPKGGFTLALVPITAAETLSESQFNMYYMRALALRAIEENCNLMVYRAKEVKVPRDSSEDMIGTTLDPNFVLHTLRSTKGVEPATGIPLPNSGITVRLSY